jgi:hypothetical protein
LTLVYSFGGLDFFPKQFILTYNGAILASEALWLSSWPLDVGKSLHMHFLNFLFFIAADEPPDEPQASYWDFGKYYL